MEFKGFVKERRELILDSVAELYTHPAYIIPAYRDLSTLWVS